MGRIITKTIYCANSHGRYMAYFEEKRPGEWVGIRSEKLSDVGFFERKRLKSQVNPSGKKPILLRTISNIGSSTNNNSNYSGKFFSGKLKCPTCGNTGFVKCYTCGELTCLPSNGKHFTCAVCGNSGNITRTIDSINGCSANNSKKNSINNKSTFQPKNKKY